MRKLALPLTIAASLALSSAAFAAPMVTKGVIAKLDPTACTITLKNNSRVFDFGPKCDFSKLKVGENVSITWTLKTMYEASAVKAG
jgi:hypothetical protein